MNRDASVSMCKYIANNVSSSISRRISEQSSAINSDCYVLITTETAEQHGTFNLFHFQYDRM